MKKLIILTTMVFTSLAANAENNDSQPNTFFRMVCQDFFDHTPGAYSNLNLPPRTFILEQLYTDDYTGDELIDIFPDLRRDAKAIPFRVIINNDEQISLRGMSIEQRTTTIERILADPRSQQEFDSSTGFGTIEGTGDLLSDSFYFNETGGRGFRLGTGSRLRSDGTQGANLHPQQRQGYDGGASISYDCYPPQAIAIEQNPVQTGSPSTDANGSASGY
jgi:hypothetical protein